MPKGLTLWLRIVLGAVFIVLALMGYEIVSNYKGPLGDLVKAFVAGPEKGTGASAPPPAPAQIPLRMDADAQGQSPPASPGSAKPASLSLFDTAWLVLMLVLTCMFAWLILELRHRLDETAGVAPAIRDLQHALDGGSFREKGLRDRPVRIIDFAAELQDRFERLEGRLDAVEKAIGRNSPESEHEGHKAGPSARIDPKPAAAERRSQIEKEYLQLLVNQLPEEFSRFAEYRCVQAVEKKLNGDIYLSDEPPANALHWLVEDKRSGCGLLFPGRVTIARLGSLMTDGGSGLRQLLGFAFDIESGSQADFQAALVQFGDSEAAPLVVYAKGSIRLPWKG